MSDAVHVAKWRAREEGQRRAPSGWALSLSGELATWAAQRGELDLQPPTELTCQSYLKLNRDNRRWTVYWLDGFSRKPDPTDVNQGVVALKRNAEDFAASVCTKRDQRLWWAIQGSARSVDPAQASE